MVLWAWGSSLAQMSRGEFSLRAKSIGPSHLCSTGSTALGIFLARSEHPPARAHMKKVLMVCTGNLDRSPTAATVVAKMRAPVWVASAGTEPWAQNQVTQELVEEADVICVMEEAHRRFIQRRFGDTHAAKVIVLEVADNYIAGEQHLVDLLSPKLRSALNLNRPGNSDR